MEKQIDVNHYANNCPMYEYANGYPKPESPWSCRGCKHSADPDRYDPGCKHPDRIEREIPGKEVIL